MWTVVVIKAGFDLDLKQPKVNGRACRGLCRPELLMKRSECERQTGECPNTSVIIVTPSSPRLWARLESCQRLFSGLVLACPYCFNTSDTLGSLHQHAQWAAQFSLSAAWMTIVLYTGYLLTNDGPLAGLSCAVWLCNLKVIPVNTVLFLRFSKGCKWRNNMLHFLISNDTCNYCPYF